MARNILKKYWLLIIALANSLTLVWAFDFFPTIDGPAHVHLAYGLKEAMLGNAFYADFFQFNDALSPNLLTEILLFLLMFIFSPLVAEKILLTLYFTGFAITSVLVLKAIRPNTDFPPIVLFIFLCSMSFPLGFGFYNFSFSTVLLLGWLAFWWHTRNKTGWRVLAGHFIFSSICYATHIFALIASLLAIASIGVGVAVRELFLRKADNTQSLLWWKHYLYTHLLQPVMGSVPALSMGLFFLFENLNFHNLNGTAAVSGNQGLARVMFLLSGKTLAFYGSAERVIMAFFSIIVIELVFFYALRGGRFRESLPFCLGAGVFLLVYFVMPFQVMVRWMPLRILPLVFVLLLLWVASLLPEKYPVKILSIAGLAILLAVMPVRFLYFQRLNDQFKEFISLRSRIHPQSTLVSLRLSSGVLKGKMFIQAGSHLATLTKSVDLKNFQGMASHHPIQFRENRSAYAALGGDAAIVAVPPKVNIMNYERETGRSIDYILLWGEVPKGGEATYKFLLQQLEDHYELVAVSKPRGWQRLYQRHDLLR